jgi:hypothetical protein
MKKLILISALAVLTSLPATAQSISIGPGGIGVDVDRRDRDRRRWREERDVTVTGSTRRCRTIVQERENRFGQVERRRIRECE